MNRYFHNSLIKPEENNDYSGSFGKVYNIDNKTVIKYMSNSKKLNCYHIRELATCIHLLKYPSITDYCILPNKYNYTKDGLLIEFDHGGETLFTSFTVPVLKKIQLAKKLIVAAGNIFLKTGVIHRDIRLANIVWNNNNPDTLKLIDFGSARLVDRVNETGFDSFTSVIGSSPYRSPEALLGSSEYGSKLDIWSVGVTILNMFNERFVFGAENDYNVLTKIISSLGINNEQSRFLSTLPNWEEYRSLNKMPTTGTHSLFDNCPDILVDLLEQMLDLNPDRRISWKNILKHRFIQDNKHKKHLPNYIRKKIKLNKFQYESGPIETMISMAESVGVSNTSIHSAIKLINNYLYITNNENSNIISFAAMLIAVKFYDTDPLICEADVESLTDEEYTVNMLTKTMTHIINVCPDINKYY
jgi:serine/threonine protein kinase